MLELNALTLALGANRYSFDLTAQKNSTTAVYGASGAGKSTLLNAIAGFIKPSSGELAWNKQSLLKLRVEQRPVTSLFQQHNLFRHLNIEQNIGLGIDPGLKLSKQDKQRVSGALEEVGLSGHQYKTPDQLSGGEQQRAALARCLLREQPILLLDEPYSALDEQTRHDMLTLTRQVVSEHELCCLLVTHNQQDAQLLNARSLELSNGILKAH